MNTTILAWELLCAALLWSVFCRLVRTNTSTLLAVRLSIYQLGIFALCGMAAPMYGWQPDALIVALIWVCLCMQVVAARHWRYGVPASFQRNPLHPHGLSNQGRQ